MATYQTTVGDLIAQLSVYPHGVPVYVAVSEDDELVGHVSVKDAHGDSQVVVVQGGMVTDVSDSEQGGDS